MEGLLVQGNACSGNALMYNNEESDEDTLNNFI
jgi:hypothetical protein